MKLAANSGGLPVFEEAQDRAGGVEAVDLAVAAEDDAGRGGRSWRSGDGGRCHRSRRRRRWRRLSRACSEEEAVDGLEEGLRLVSRRRNWLRRLA